MSNKYVFFDGNELERSGIDVSVLEDWFKEMETADYDRDYFMAYPVFRVTWYDRNDDECNNFFDVESPREFARMVAFVEEVGRDNVEAIEVVTIRVTKEPLDIKKKNS
jgi:hypothetical protein